MSEISITPNSMTPNGHEFDLQLSESSSRKHLFKSLDNKDIKELRRRRSETAVELRKRRKDDNFEKKRHIFENFSFDNYSEDEEIESTIDEILLLLKSKNMNMNEIGVKYIRDARRLISKEFESNDESALITTNKFLEDDVLYKLIDGLVSENCSMSLLIEILSLIVQLSSGNAFREIRASLLLKSGIISKLIPFLSYDNSIVVEKSVMVLANISSASEQMKDIILSTEFLLKLLPLIVSEVSMSSSRNTDRIDCVRAMSWALFVLCQHKDIKSYKTVEDLFIYLVKLLQYPDNNVKANVLRTLSRTTERNLNFEESESAPILRVVRMMTSNTSLLNDIIEYLSPQNNDVVFYAIRVIGNIVSWDESFAQIVIHSGALNKFKDLITHQNARVQKEVVYTIANITAGNSAQIQAVIDWNLIPQIVELLYFGDYKTQLEVSYALLHISTIGTPKQMYYIININDTIPNMNVFDAMATMLTCTDANAVEIALKIYNNLLEFAKKAKVLSIAINKCENCSAVYHIESLINTGNLYNSDLAEHLINEFFSKDTSLEECMNENNERMEFDFSF